MPLDQQQQFLKRKDNKYFSESLDTSTSSSRQKLQHLFHEIEKEFDSITRENLILQEKVDLLNEKLENVASPNDKLMALDSSKKGHMRSFSSGGQKMKTAYKLKAQTSKIVSSFKAPLLHGVQIREFSAHKDGIWEVSAAQTCGPSTRSGLFATASADHSAIVWSMESGKSLLTYQGHKGSVNSVRFHSSKDLVITSSGDCTAHLWQTNIDTISPKMASSEEDIVESNDEMAIGQATGAALTQQSNATKTNLIEFEGHAGPVAAADFVASNDQLITASWDRTAHLHDIEHKSIVTTLIGHDQELTNVATHPYQKMAATASKDTTFRLWDFRETVQAVSVFQGHSESVNCVVFVGDDKMISSSDDRTVKIWDLKNMRSALVTITTVSANNRVSVSSANVIAIAHDNRQIRLFDLNGQRLARLPRSSRVGHRLMVTSTSWLSDSCLLSSSFDRRVLLWQIQSSSSCKTSKTAPKDKDGEF